VLALKAGTFSKTKTMNYDSIQDELTELYQELNAAENDLHISCKSSLLLDSGEENWVRDQQRLIAALRAKIQSLTVLISN
jgi:hypothetical protein